MFGKKERHSHRARRRTFLWSLAGLAGLALTIALFASSHPHSTIVLDINSDDAAVIAGNLLLSLDIDTLRYSIRPMLLQNRQAIREAYNRHGQLMGNEELRKAGSAYYWKIRVYRIDPSASLVVRLSNTDERAVERAVERFFSGDILIHLNGRGNLRHLRIALPDSIVPPSIDEWQAFENMRTFVTDNLEEEVSIPLQRVRSLNDLDSLADSMGISRVSSNTTEHRTDHVFSWSVYSKASGDSLHITTSMAGALLSELTVETGRASTVAYSDEPIVGDGLKAVFYIGVSLLLILTGVKRLRAWEMGFRTAGIVGAFAAVLFGLWFGMQLLLEEAFRAEVLLPLAIAPLFVGAAMFVLWTVAEAMTREMWKEKFIEIDLISRGHLLNSRLGHSVLRGLAGGLTLVGGALLGMHLLAGVEAPMLHESTERGLEQFSVLSPVLFITGTAMTSSLFIIGLSVFFLVSWLRRHIASVAVLLPVSASLFALSNPISIFPVGLGIILTFGLGIILVALFITTDAFTTLVASITALVLHHGVAFLSPWNTAYRSEGLQILLLGVGAVLYAVLALSTRDHSVDFEEIAPRFQRYISERQRLARELGIARDVQMSFLPKSIPTFHGLDIASRCTPAMEVGGDYYDFLVRDPSRLGVVVGDVSGKGTQAAFFMTLTKGFLKALGRTSDSPSDVLVEMNRLFFDNVERGHFVSMLYAIFDIERMEVTFARAGHTHPLLRRPDGTVESLRSSGIALGIESGEGFSRSIEEITVPLHPGDVFVLYTDGYTEAMSKTREEFGDERFSQTLSRCDGDSKEILDCLYRETQRFVGRAKQQDDMTMVVLRVTG